MSIHSVLIHSLIHQRWFRRISILFIVAGKMAVWMFTGMLSTITLGFWLLYTIPVWAITGGIATGSTSREPVVSYPGYPLSSFRLYARFPQGLPPGIDPLALKRKPFLPE